MSKLVDKIESVMRKINPLRLDGDYYYDAKILVENLRSWPQCSSSSIGELCEISFVLYLYDKGYDYDVERWNMMVAEITWLLEKLGAKKRVKKIRKQLLTAVRMKKIRKELLATAMSPERVYSMNQRYGASAAHETFA